MRKQLSKEDAFTLSEVLLVLSVIGVVAALTIPTLIQKVNDDQYKAKWKKTYSVASQVGTSLFSEYGGSLKGVCTDSNCWKNISKKYFNIIRECNPGSTIGNCWTPNNMKYLNGSDDTTWDTPAFVNTQGAIVTADGAAIFFEFFGTNCAYGASEECFRFNVDVNGMQGPNTYGKDIFFAHVYNVGPKVSPMNGDCTTDGRGCSTEYLYK